MADHTSASIFGDFFRLLAENPDKRGRALAVRVWWQSQAYDFCPTQMECGDALVALGLAKRGVHPDYPEDGTQLLYFGDGLPELDPTHQPSS